MAGYAETERRIKEERAQIWEGMKPTLAKLHAGEHISPEDREKWDQGEAALDKLANDLRMNEQAKMHEDATADTRGAGGATELTLEQKEERAFDAYLRYGREGLERSPDLRGILRPGDPTLSEVRFTPLSTAPGAPAAGSALGGEGGYLVPQGFWANLQIALKAYGGIVPLFQQVTTSTGNPMPWPTMDPTGIVGSILAENTQVTEVDFTFGQGMLSAWTYTSGLHLASLQIVNDSAFSVDTFVRNRVGEAIGRALAAHAHTGTGSSQPLGIETAIAAVGAVSGLGGTGGSGSKGGLYLPVAASKVSTFANPAGATKLSQASMGFDDVANMVATVDAAYRVSGGTQPGGGGAQYGGAYWVMADTDMAKMRQITSTTGLPLWQPNIQMGGNNADNLWGFPVYIDNNTTLMSGVASTQGGPIFGNYQHAMVYRLVNQAAVLRLVERYADFLQVGYVGFIRADIRSNDMRAVTQFKMSAT